MVEAQPFLERNRHPNQNIVALQQPRYVLDLVSLTFVVHFLRTRLISCVSTCFIAQFPLPSPKSNHQPEYGDDEASFNLFNQSFDTMSDTATYLRDMQHAETAGNLEGRNHRRDASQNMDISLPALGQYTNGDVSPIRVFDQGRGRSIPGMEPIPVHFPQDDEEAVAAAHVHGHYGDVGHSHQAPGVATNPYGGSLESNPFFVLRCARDAFSKCTFLLPCLRPADPCAVNVSEHGSFQHYQGSDNLAYHEVSPSVLVVL